MSFEALTIETLVDRLSGNQDLARRLGPVAAGWNVREVGDGNLNLVFIVEGTHGAAVIKQALPYVRMVGESWPLSVRRSFFEYHALTRQAERDLGRVPTVYFFDEDQAMIAMEYLTPHVMLRQALIAGRKPNFLGEHLGTFLARTLFRGSDLQMQTSDRKRDMALFADNVELCGITENLIFSEPYFEAEMNRHTSPHLDAFVAEIQDDRDLRIEAQRLKHLFISSAETMLHGDLHTGSIMVTDDEAKVIDPEFAFYGPMAFDVGILLANFWMAYFSQRGHEDAAGRRDDSRRYILDVVEHIWSVFRTEFSHLWRTERTGIMYDRRLFEARDDMTGAEQALSGFLDQIWVDALGFAGLECHRRILGLAHNAEFETIADEALRARCEVNVLRFGRHMVLKRGLIRAPKDVNELAMQLESGLPN